LRAEPVTDYAEGGALVTGNESMSDDLVFYTNPMSRGRIVRWMLEETGQPYQTEIVAYGADMKSEAFRAINPMGKVPALRHGDAVVTECAAICAYLADAFPSAGLAPGLGERERGPYFRWLFFTAGPMEAAVTNRALGFVTPEGRERMTGWGRFEDVMDTLEQALQEGPYLLGDRFSAADVYVGSQIGFGLSFGTIEKRPRFEEYWSRLAQRPALARANAIDDKLMPPKV
jgi:glutathione S-transferase